MSYQFIPVSVDDKAIKDVAELLRIVFPDANKYSDTFIEWQYKNNPDGQVVGYNAYENGVLAAHYALIPLDAELFGKHEKGLLSLNTATHPSHQGKKLFTLLAEKTYQLAAEKGYGFVVGVANANSTPGFVNKLGFQLVGNLDAKLGFGKVVSSANNNSIQFIKKWNKESFEWKLSNPATKYKIKNNIVFSVTDKPGFEAILMDTTNLFKVPDNTTDLGFRPIKLWIGINHSINWNGSFYFNVPVKLRPSPLNFIFKDLTKANRKLEIKNVRLNALDFDAY